MCGRSGSVIAAKPPLGVAVDLGDRRASGSVRKVMPSGMIALRVRLVPLLVKPVVPGSMHDRVPELADPSRAKNTRPQKPVIIEGKFTDAQTPPKSMSLTRASMS